VGTGRDLAPALVATLVGGLLVAFKGLTWVLEILAARRLVHDPDAWGGTAPDPGMFSTWDFAGSRVSDLIPSTVAALLVAVAWWPAWHRRTQAAWTLAATGVALAAVGVAWR
jgi:hypothetical protein